MTPEETRKPIYQLRRKPYRIGQVSPVDQFDILADFQPIGTIEGEGHAQALTELFWTLQCDHPQESVVVMVGELPYEDDIEAKKISIEHLMCFKCGRILSEYPVDGDKEA